MADRIKFDEKEIESKISKISASSETDKLSHSPESQIKYFEELIQRATDKSDYELHQIKKRQLKFQYANRLLCLIVFWLFVVICFVLLAGFKNNTGFELGDNVLIAFITSTTATVIGLFHYVGRWLYLASPKPNKNETTMPEGK